MKKGQITILKDLILILVVAIGLFSMVSMIGDGLKKSTRGTDCLAGMNLKAQTTFETMSGFTNYEGVDTACPVYRVTISDKKTVIKKKDKKFETIKYDYLDNDTVNDIISKELMYCWYQYGAGNIEIFWVPGNFLKTLRLSDSYAKGCRICSEITFDLETNPLGGFGGFYDYMKNNGITNKQILNDVSANSYYSYIAESDRICEKDHLSEEGDNCWEKYAYKSGLRVDETYFDPGTTYLTIITRQGIKKASKDDDKRTINAYVVKASDYKRTELCDYPLPFK